MCSVIGDGYLCAQNTGSTSSRTPIYRVLICHCVDQVINYSLELLFYVSWLRSSQSMRGTIEPGQCCLQPTPVTGCGICAYQVPAIICLGARDRTVGRRHIVRAAIVTPHSACVCSPTSRKPQD